jgi:hypothetical protein
MRIPFTVAMVAFLAGAAQSGEFEIKLTVEEPAGLARKAEPVSGGIPLPAGLFKKDQAFAVFAGAQEIPAQVLPLVVDEKDFLRWVLVDTQVDLGAKEKKELVLRAAAPAAKPASLIKVTDDASGVTVDTGKVRFTVAKDKPFSLFSSVEAGGKPVAGGGECAYVDVTTGPEGKRYVADKPSAVTVEYSGPVRATVCARGRFVGDDQTKLGYVARITAWAGRSDVHVKYSLANSNEGNYTWRRIKESTVRLKLAGEPSGSLLGAGKPVEGGAEAWMLQSARVVRAAVHSSDSLGENPCYHQTPGAAGPGGAKAAGGDKELWTSSGKGDQSEGWLLARLGGGAVAVHDLYFVDDPPRKLALSKGHLELAGIAEPADPAKWPFNDVGRWLFDCSHLSSQYVLDFAPAADAAALAAQARAARGRLHLMAAPAWYFETEALPVGKYGTQADELACYDKWGWKYDKGRAPTRADNKLVTIPRWSCGDDNHYTSEQDTLDGLALMYLRTGARAFYDGAETWANYFMDLQAWRTDGWRWKDGGTWWTNRGSPIGNAPQRGADPVVGMRNRLILAGADVKAGQHSVKDSPVELKIDLSQAALQDIHFLARAKACHCHNWGEGISTWFLLTGDRDALDTSLDCAEQNYDTQRRGFGKAPGKAAGFSRDFTRACYLINASRLCVPSDPYLAEASDYLARVYLERPEKEPRGFLNGPAKTDMKTIEQKVGPNGLAKMKELGVTLEADGRLSDPKTGAKWLPLDHPQTWMYPPLSKAMEIYVRITGSEDAHDWLIAYGQAVARVLYQEKHGCLNYNHFLVDFPVKGWAWDRSSWDLPEGATSGKGSGINGYLAEFHPDVIARAYLLCGEPFLKQRAMDMWYGATHPGSDVAEGKRTLAVGRWVNVYSTHDETVCFTGKTFYIWAHERKDDKPPAAVADLKVTVAGDKATVSFTAPADEGGGKVVRYQVKCADRPLVDYGKFLELFKENKEAGVINGWMAANVKDEPAPQAPGAKESFAVSGVPAGAKFFAVLSFDDSSNRSALSNVAEVGK